MKTRLLAIALFLIGLACIAVQAQSPNVRAVIFPAPRVATAAVSTTVLDGAKKGAGITLSGGNLIATNAVSNNDSVLSVAGAATGLKFFQAVYGACATPGHCLVGLGNASTGLNSFLGADTNSFGWAGDGSLYNCIGVGCTGIQTFAAGDTLSVAIDLGNKKIYLRTNSGNWNNSPSADPTMNVGGLDYSAVTGTIFAAAGTFQDATAITVNFGASSYSPAAPAGYGNF